MSKGGFDAIVGNPPWVDIKGMDPTLVRYYFERYACTENRMNIYATFIEKALRLLKQHGRFGMITPSSYLTQSSYTKLRRLMLDAHSISTIIRTPDNTFHGVIAESSIIILAKTTDNVETEVVVYPTRAELTTLSYQEATHRAFISAGRWQQDDTYIFNLYVNPEKDELLEKVKSKGVSLVSLYDFSLGLTPYDKYRGHTKKQIEERAFHSERKESDDYQPILEGGDIRRYAVVWGGNEYIKYGPWLGAPREKRFFTKPRLLIRQIISGNPLRIYAGYTDQELYNAQVGFNLLKHADVQESDFYILALLNSWLMTWYHRNKYLDPGKNTFQKILIQDAKDFPIRRIDFTDKVDSGRHQAIVALVEQMQEAKRRLAAARSDAERTQLERKCEYLDAEIDKLVYQLYGLTEEEIRIVEGRE